MNTLQKVLLVITLLLLGGCSLAGMAYNQAPYFIASELEDAFDLNRAQIDQLDARLEQFIAWHREEELPRYREFLDRAALATADGITAAEFLGLQKDVTDARDRSLEKIIDNLGDLAVSLTPQQLESYQQYHREGSEEFLDYLEKSPQQREIYRVERAYDRLESWFGDFDFFLEQKINARLQTVPDIYQPWFEFREQRHLALVKALRDDIGKPVDRQKLKAIMLDPTTDYARAFEPLRLAYWQGYAAALAEIGSWLSDQQRQHAVSRLQRYARVVDRLGQPG